MDKNTLSQYGWVVIVLIVLAIMIGLASPFGNFISASVNNTTHGFGDKVEESLKINGYSNAISAMKPLAFTLTQPFLSQATEAQTPNYIYAKQQWARSPEEAVEVKDGYTYEGEPVTGSCYGTGSIIRAYKDGSLVGTYHLVVIGDVNGDGGCDVLDAAVIAVIKFKEVGLNGAELAAADLNGNGILDEGSDGTTTEDYDAVSELSVTREDYLRYYNMLIGRSANIMVSKQLNKISAFKDVTKVVFEKTQPENLTIVPTSTAIAANDNNAYNLATFSGNILGYLTSSGTDKVLHIAGKDDVIVAPESLANMFASLSKLKSVDFNGCFDTRYVTSMASMFANSSSLETISGLNDFNTQNVKDMSSMFSGINVKTLDVSGFDTRDVATFYNMFGYSTALKNITGLNNFNTSKATTFAEMFSGCCALESVDVSNFDTSNATSIGAMFMCCDVLESIDVSNFNTSKVEEFDYLFAYSCALTELDISNFDTRAATIMDGMFEGCTDLQHVYVGENWDDHGTTGDAMFYDCGVNAVERK